MIGGISGVGSYGMGVAGSFYQSRLAERLQGAQQSQQNPVYTAKKTPSLETPVQPVTPAKAVSTGEASLPELALRLENDPSAMAGRMRTRYGDISPEGVFEEKGNAGSPVLNAEHNTLEGQLNKAEGALAKDDLGAAQQVLNKGLPVQESGKQAEELPALPGQDKAEEPTANVEASGAESAQKAAEDGECETCENRKYQDGSDDMGVSYQTPTNIKPEQAASAVKGHEMEHVYREQAKAEREGREVVSQTVTMHTEICPECGKAFVAGGTTETVTKAASSDKVQEPQTDSIQAPDALQPDATKANTNNPLAKQSTPENGIGKQSAPANGIGTQSEPKTGVQNQNEDQKNATSVQQNQNAQNATQQQKNGHVPFFAIA